MPQVALATARESGIHALAHDLLQEIVARNLSRYWRDSGTRLDQLIVVEGGKDGDLDVRRIGRSALRLID
jgi:hypothetical protein